MPKKILTSLKGTKLFGSISSAAADKPERDHVLIQLHEKKHGRTKRFTASLANMAMMIADILGIDVDDDTRRPIIVDTVADLKALEGVPGQVYETLGYYAAAGAGSARYLCMTLQAARAIKGAAAWEPDGHVEHSMATNVALFISEGDLLHLQAGMSSDGVSDDAPAFVAAASFLKNTGRSIIISAGTVAIHERVEIAGFTLEIADGASIKVEGADAAPFAQGALVIMDNGRLTGHGDIYTSGDMTPTAGSHVVRQDSGVIDGDLTVYSQLSEGVFHNRGNSKIKVVGSQTRCFRSRPSVDEPTFLEIEYHNAGILYTDRAVLTPIVLPTDVRAVEVRPRIPINSLYDITINGAYSYKNGAWIGYEGPENDNSVDMTNVITRGFLKYSGYYVDENGLAVVGSGRSGNWLIAGCPDVVAEGSSYISQGYSVAVTKGSHRAVTSGRHIGDEGDPNVAVVRSNDVVVGGHLSSGTVGVSVGEDGDRADRCTIRSTIRNSLNEAVRVYAASHTKISGANIEYPAMGSPKNGEWGGLGRIVPAIRVLKDKHGAQDITIENTTFSGGYTHDVLELGLDEKTGVAADGTLRVKRSNNTYNCAMVPHENIDERNLTGSHTMGSEFVKMTTHTETDGYAAVGESTIADGGTIRYILSPLATVFQNMAEYADAGETLEESMSTLRVVWYMQYRSAMGHNGSRFARFGVTSASNPNHVTQTFYGVAAAYSKMLGRPLRDGEYMPFSVPLFDLIHDDADPTALQYFVVLLDDAPAGYHFRMTNPVVVEVPSRV